MKFYIEAYYEDGTRKLGNLDGQAVMDVKNYRNTKHYRLLKSGSFPAMRSVHHWKIVDYKGELLEVVTNPNFRRK